MTTASPFTNGFWTWDEDDDCLKFNSRETQKLTRPGASLTTIITTNLAAPTTFTFREHIDAVEQLRFKRQYQRRSKPDEPDVVILQDVKDVVFFFANPDDLTLEFINYFHIPTMDRFLRALIVYFQYYLQVWESLMKRREESKRKLWQPVVDELENIVRDDLADLRSMVAREYCSIIAGKCDAKRFHHMNNKNNQSLSGKDRQLFERMICFAGRVVWIALERKHLSLIEVELNRLLRSTKFNLMLHSFGKSRPIFTARKGEARVLKGTADIKERKLLTHSPATKELIFANHDHRMLAIGIVNIKPSDERMRYLEIAYTAPEECLLELGVTVGILGIPRNELEPILTPKERTSEDINKEVRELPKFKLPPRVHHKDETMPNSFPDEPCRFHESRQTVAAREHQKRVWKEYVEQMALRGDSSSSSSSRRVSFVSRPHLMSMRRRSGSVVKPKAKAVTIEQQDRKFSS